MRYATWSVQHDREMRKKLRLSQRILSAIMTPVMVFSMTGMNFSVAGLMTAHAEDAIVATDTVTTPASTPAPATVEAPKVDIPKVDPTPAPVIPKVETPAPASVVDPAPKAADPVVAPVTDPTPTPAPTVDSTPAPDSDSTPAIVPATTVPTTPTVDAAGEATTERVIPEWVADGNKQTTGSSVVLGKKYVAPQNDQVTVTFTKLPENAGKLSIEEITLTPEQVASLHALSNKAYDITSDMADGTFAYTMTLPKPKDQKNVQIKYAEDTAGLANAETVASGDVTTKTNSVSAELDHFTTFVVTVTSGASIDVTKIERGAINPTMNVTLAGDTFVGTIDSPNTDSWTISSGTTTLHDPVVTITSSTTATVAFTGTTALGSISIKANSAAVKAGGDINAVIVDVADTIAPAETSVTLNQTAKTITTVFSEVVHLVNDDYSAHPTLTKDDLGIYAYTAGSWHNVDVVSISAVTLVDKVLTVTYTGTLPIGTYIIDTYGTKVVDASGNEMVDAGALTFEVTDATLPAESSVVLDQTAKKVTTTFSEVVHLVNDDYSAHPTLTKDDLGIYAYTAGSWHNVDVVSISAVTLVDKVLTVTYTGTLPIGTYIIDTYGTKVVDASGNEMVDAGALTFEVTDATLPAESSVVLDQTAKKVTTTFSEVVHLVNDDYSAHPTLTKDDLGIYAYTAGSWHNVDVVSISAVTLVDKVLTVTYTGTLPIGTYIIDTYGTKVVDASGNEMVDAGALTFDATGVIDTPSIAGVTAPVTDAIPTSTITATDLYTATISWSGAPVTFHPGTAYTATITITPKSGYTLTGVTSDYFTVAGATATNSANSGVISAVFPTTATKQLTIADPSSLTLSKTYDGTTTAAVTAGALSGVVSGDAVTVSAVATYNSKDFGTGKTITVEYTLSGNDAAKYIKPVNYTIATGIITQATSTTEVTCPTDSQTYTGSAITPCTVSVTGAGGLNLTPDPTYASNTVVGTASASYTYAGDANHSGSGDSKNFDITAKHITGTFTASNKVYDGNDSATVTGRALVGAVVGDVVSLSGGTATFNNVNVADGKTVTLTGATLAGAAAVNYTLDSVATTTANITQANLTITADDISKAHGATDPTLTASYDGFVNSETESVLDTPVTLTRDAGEAVGSYTITAHGAADANYNIAYVDGTFSIGQTTPDGDGNATLDNSNPQVVITDGSQAVTLEITNGTTDPSIDVSGLLGGGVSGTLPEITINAGVASVVIPDGTIVTGPAGWDGVIGGPAAGSSNGDSAPSGFAVGGTVISVGSPDKTLTFSVPVVITLPGVTGTVGYRPAGSTQWHEITNVCTGTYESPTGAPAGGECAISNGTDTKILTYHFTSFGNLLDTQAPDAVTSLKAKYGPKTDGKVEVTWHAKDSDISKTLVYRGETKHFTMNWDSRVAKQNKSDESYIDKNVEPGKTYYYKVVTEDAAGNQSDAEVIKIVIPEGDVAATGVLQGTEPAPNDKADKSGTVGTGTASDVSGTVSGATTGDQTVTDKGAAVLGADTQAGGFWGSVWMWIIVIGLGAGAVTIFMRRRPKGIA